MREVWIRRAFMDFFRAGACSGRAMKIKISGRRGDSLFLAMCWIKEKSSKFEVSTMMFIVPLLC